MPELSLTSSLTLSQQASSILQCTTKASTEDDDSVLELRLEREELDEDELELDEEELELDEDELDDELEDELDEDNELEEELVESELHELVLPGAAEVQELVLGEDGDERVLSKEQASLSMKPDSNMTESVQASSSGAPYREFLTARTFPAPPTVVPMTQR